VPHDCGIGPCAGVFFLREDAMHAFCRKSNLLWVVLLAFGLVAALPTPSAARPRPGKPSQGFRLFAKATGALTVNRIYCGLGSAGEICVDSLNSSTIGGGFWPKGTADQYVFNSGLQLAGIIGDDANAEWAGDTTAGQLFSPRGDNVGEQVEPIFNASDPVDLANWPEAAKVPQGDASEELYDPLLRGRVSASQGDVWFLSWEGNPSFSAGREHPLGIMVEQRGMGWNYPSGNEDVLYFIYTFYNVTARDPGVYSAVRPGMREIVERQGAKFQDLNENKYSIDIPDGGYTLTDLFAAFGADMDVAESGSNYASVNVPFSLGYTYENTFSGTAEWTFDPGIFGAPFFPGAGFVGVKYLKSPVINNAEVGLTLFGNTINQGAFDDASNATQLFRYLSNNISVAAGDAACNTGNPQITKICYINNGQAADMRFFQASGPLTLGPGQFASIVVAYIFAAPVSVGACTGAGSCTLTPGDPTRLSNPAQLAVGANPVDSVAGFDGYTDVNGDGIVQQGEVKVVPGSLLGKAVTAQLIFQGKFLLPFAPESPSFFLIPGSNQVTVLWQPSTTETIGDPFFAVASQPTVIDPVTQTPTTNLLYDPNYREKDVEGYRVYRGRVDSPNSLTLIAQFDYAGTFITDFGGQVNPTELCAPELGLGNTFVVDPVSGDSALGCAVPFDSVGAGEVPTVSQEIPLVGPIVQIVKGKGRGELATGKAILFQSDTAITGAASGCLVRGTPAACALRDTGVPFTFVDRTAKNNLRYFYAVTAFDINSFQSGPSSIESARVTKAVTPVAPASNLTNTAVLRTNVVGRSKAQDSVFTADPTLDATTGKFSGPFAPAAGDLHFAGEFARQVVAAPGAVSIKLDSLTLGSAYDGAPTTYYFTATTGGGQAVAFTFPIVQDQFDVAVASNGVFDGVPVDPGLAQRFGGNQSFSLKAEFIQSLPGSWYTSTQGRGCANADASSGAPGFTSPNACDYNGARWFLGPSPQNNETVDNPTAGNQASGGANVPTTLSNAGGIAGVAVIREDHAYQTTQNIYRDIEAVPGGAARAADFNVYWGDGGKVDSVIDVTHDVVVPFSPVAGGSWGFLNQAATTVGASFDARAELTSGDIGCVEPWLSSPAAQGRYACTGAVPYALSETAVPGPVAYQIGALNTGTPLTLNSVQTSPAGAGLGFIMYLPGHFFTFELPAGGALPAKGVVWTMRSYIGAINGGHGDAGDEGNYSFTSVPRAVTAVGSTVRLSFDVTNQVAASTSTDLRRVHTVPDPYYVTSAFEQDPAGKIIKFVNLPAEAIIRIYSSSGVLVALLEHRSSTFGGDETWNVRNRNNQVVASGVYFYHVEAGDARRVGRFTVVNFAQ
jgi:hypothetical protein